ncbi:MAG TPA: Tn3 family transposase, partial [Candidatus Angelobacter sp.]|nr:Tn3 family transposase [Candidatus Angelobacter sp.]
AQVMTHPADLINAVIERLRAERCELFRFATLDRLVHRVRNVAHRRIFRRVVGRLTPSEIQHLDALLKTREIVQRQSDFQELKESPKRPSLTPLERLLDHLDWLEGLEIGEGALRDLPPALVRHFASQAKALLVAFP